MAERAAHNRSVAGSNPAGPIYSLEGQATDMCRSIKTLRHPEQTPTDDELKAAALQFVRKVSGYRAPSRANQAAFDRAVLEIAASTRVLFDNLVIR